MQFRSFLSQSWKPSQRQPSPEIIWKSYGCLWTDSCKELWCYAQSSSTTCLLLETVKISDAQGHSPMSYFSCQHQEVNSLRTVSSSARYWRSPITFSSESNLHKKRFWLPDIVLRRPVNNWNPIRKIQFADVFVTDPFKLQKVQDNIFHIFTS